MVSVEGVVLVTRGILQTTYRDMLDLSFILHHSLPSWFWVDFTVFYQASLNLDLIWFHLVWIQSYARLGPIGAWNQFRSLHLILLPFLLYLTSYKRSSCFSPALPVAVRSSFNRSILYVPRITRPSGREYENINEAKLRINAIKHWRSGYGEKASRLSL